MRYEKDIVSNLTVNQIPRSLIEDLKKGDHRSFSLIFAKYYKQTSAFVNAIVKHKADAEDIVGNIFASLWANRERLESEKNFNAYFFSMVRNEVFNHFRSSKVKNKYLSSLADYEFSHAADEVYIAKESEFLIRLTVSRMPEQRRNVYRMSREEGLDNNAISQRLGVSKKVVERHLRLALTDIRNTLSLYMMFFI